MNPDSLLWKHLKSGGLYYIVSETARIEATLEPSVIYRRLADGSVWVRPHKEFFDGRFVKIDAVHMNKLERQTL